MRRIVLLSTLSSGGRRSGHRSPRVAVVATTRNTDDSYLAGSHDKIRTAMAGRMTRSTFPDAVRDQLRARGLRWTPQRRLILDVITEAEGHVTGAEFVDRCRARDPDTTPSTVYRTLDVLEELGYLAHSHAADGREEYHVLPVAEHAHLHCSRCGGSWEVGPDEIVGLVRGLHRDRGFAVDVAHLTIAGRCRECAAGEA
jgi:Fur family transcriptional regulator, ferric uptake regulator